MVTQPYRKRPGEWSRLWFWEVAQRMRIFFLVIFSLFIVGCGQREAEPQVSDEVVRLSALVRTDSVTVTVKNVSSELLTLHHCTHHTFLTGVQQPAYKPCMPEEVRLGPGESVTDQIPIEKWLPEEQAQVTLRYVYCDQTHTLSLPLPHPR